MYTRDGSSGMDAFLCDKCGTEIEGTIHRVEMDTPPCPECPEGYEVELCERCYLIWTEGLDQE